MKKQVINVDGMSCEHCVQTITSALKDIDGVSGIQVDLEKKAVTVDYEENHTDLKTISDKIAEAGFEVVQEG
jgi:copper chaperone